MRGAVHHETRETHEIAGGARPERERPRPPLSRQGFHHGGTESTEQAARGFHAEPQRPRRFLATENTEGTKRESGERQAQWRDFTQCRRRRRRASRRRARREPFPDNSSQSPRQPPALSVLFVFFVDPKSRRLRARTSCSVWRRGVFAGAAVSSSVPGGAGPVRARDCAGCGAIRFFALRQGGRGASRGA